MPGTKKLKEEGRPTLGSLVWGIRTLHPHKTGSCTQGYGCRLSHLRLFPSFSRCRESVCPWLCVSASGVVGQDVASVQ